MKPMTMTEVVTKRVEVEKSISALKTHYEEHRLKLEQELEHLQSLEAAGEAYVEDVQIVEKFLYVEGDIDVRYDSERVKILREAAADIAVGCPFLKTRYMGCKNYDRWRDQRADTEYGYTPSHGYITFRVGLRRDAQASGVPVGADAEACVRVLIAWAEGKAPKRRSA